MPNRIVSIPGDIFGTRLIRPSITETSGTPTIDNSEMMKIAEDTLAAAKYSFTSVAAQPQQEVRANTLEADFKTAFGKMKGATAKNYRDKATKLVQMPELAREEMFGRFSKLDSKSFMTHGFSRAHEGLGELKIDKKLLGIKTPKLTVFPGTMRSTPEGLLLSSDHLRPEFDEFESVWEKTAKKAEESEIYNADQLAEIYGPVYSGDLFSDETEESDDFEEQAITDKLGFYIRRVKCVDETNPEWWGHDEIALAGVSVDETGDTKKILERFVGGGFDDGDTKWYSPHWRYHMFNLREGSSWPKGYSIVLIPAEKDHGGLSSVLNTVWARVKDYVLNLIRRYVAAGLAKYLGPVLARWVGVIVAWVVDKLVGWIIRAFRDDIFPPKVTSVRIPSFGARWPRGSTRSPYQYAHFYGHGGHYYVEYYWKLYA